MFLEVGAPGAMRGLSLLRGAQMRSHANLGRLLRLRERATILKLVLVHVYTLALSLETDALDPQIPKAYTRNLPTRRWQVGVWDEHWHEWLGFTESGTVTRSLQDKPPRPKPYESSVLGQGV